MGSTLELLRENFEKLNDTSNIEDEYGRTTNIRVVGEERNIRCS